MWKVPWLKGKVAQVSILFFQPKVKTVSSLPYPCMFYKSGLNLNTKFKVSLLWISPFQGSLPTLLPEKLQIYYRSFSCSNVPWLVLLSDKAVENREFTLCWSFGPSFDSPLQICLYLCSSQGSRYFDLFVSFCLKFIAEFMEWSAY